MLLPILFNAVLGYFVGYYATSAIIWAIETLLDEGSISNEVRSNYSEALYLLIKEKKNNAVKIGIFDDASELIADEVEITSSKGVSSSIYEGQIIYI